MDDKAIYDIFTGGPFENARDGWLKAVEDWSGAVPNGIELSFTPPPAPTEDIVTISQEDGEFWSEVVCVNPKWHNYVSPRGTVGNFGIIAFPNYSIGPEDDVENPRLIIHPQCLSFLCRRINASPEEIWNSIYGPDFRFRDNSIPCGSVDGLEYYDIDRLFCDHDDYCIYQTTLKKGLETSKQWKHEDYEWWKDSDSTKQLQWLLARPTVFPVVSLLSPSILFSTSPSTSQTPCMRVFNVLELFDVIIDCVIGQGDEVEPEERFTASSIIRTTKTIFALLQVNKSLYTTVLRDRQTLFLRLAWMHGWMLPFTPQDWNNWPNGQFHNGIVFKIETNQDWRAYLLTFLRKEDVHAVPNEGELSFTPPPAPTEGIVTISQEDGLSWSDVVCVGRRWDNYVSPRGYGCPSYIDQYNAAKKKHYSTVKDKFGTIAFPNYSLRRWDDDENPRLVMHPQCLSFLCRRINASPDQIWSSVHGPDSNYSEYFEGGQIVSGLLDELEYYDIDEFSHGDFHYCISQMTLKKGEKSTYDHWEDPNSMRKLQWLLARPTVFPVVSSLSPSIAFGTSPSMTPRARFMELFDIIIGCIIEPHIPQTQLTEELETVDCIESETQLASELQSDNTFTPYSIIQSTKTIFALLQVNKSLYTTILRDRQTLFLRLAWMHGWMLPFTPQDWRNWSNGPFHNGTVFKVGHNQDWRTYLLIFLRKGDVYVRNRWRFHRMALQFGRGRSTAKLCWRSEVGDVRFRPELKPPKSWFWERGEEEEEEEEKEVDKGRRTVRLRWF
ncbi:hypothetical protein Clacol_009477 [Clathrus columnatus]|uniref:Uncharacterized protein n=1 Tax=Clathrus columnatus TaxID=1419009 RepID=A0AAV5AS78_9AGAM|nr:hypothetical protein Clacol_009477 [Clathrus columnatus]